MSQPTQYTRAYGATYFADWSTSFPSTPHQGNKIDGELNNVKITLDGVLTNLALIQRDDGAIANATVGRDQLKDEVVQGINTPTTWAAGTVYTGRDSVIVTTGWYWALTTHTASSSFATDLGASKWQLINDFSATFSSLFLSNATPGDLAGTVGPGTSGQASRSDHVHSTPVYDAGTAALFANIMSGR